MAIGGEQRVIEVLEKEIVARGLGPGSKLPTERDLALLSGQGRTTVRRALEALEAEGRVVRQVGRGTFVATPRSAREVGGLDDVSPAEVMTARLVIEPGMMPLIVTSGTTADLAEIERCLHGGNETDSYYEFALWGTAMHRAMANATHNRMFSFIYELLDMHGNPQWSKLLRHNSSPDRLTEYKHDHREIVEALLERDGDKAQVLMRKHLLRIQTNVLGGAPLLVAAL